MEYEMARNMTLLFFFERLMDKGEPRTLHDLSCQFGARGFTKEMRQIAGGSQSGKSPVTIVSNVCWLLRWCHCRKWWKLDGKTGVIVPVSTCDGAKCIGMWAFLHLLHLFVSCLSKFLHIQFFSTFISSSLSSYWLCYVLLRDFSVVLFPVSGTTAQLYVKKM